MATAEKVNKSKVVRAYIKAHRKAMPLDISAAMKEQGIEISPSAVSNIKFLMKHKAAKKPGSRGRKKATASSNGQDKAPVKRKMKRGRRRKALAVAAPESISLSALIAAKEVVEKLGSIGAVKEAVAALEKLGG